jgi:polyhydroxyalkanoate synthesis regulator phasin
MFETVKKMLYFGLGAAALSADKVRQLIDDLVSKGEMTAEEGKKLYEEMTCRAEEERRNLNERIRTQIRDMLKEVGVADRAQIALLESRVETLERKVDELSSG